MNDLFANDFFDQPGGFVRGLAGLAADEHHLRADVSNNLDGVAKRLVHDDFLGECRGNSSHGDIAIVIVWVDVVAIAVNRVAMPHGIDIGLGHGSNSIEDACLVFWRRGEGIPEFHADAADDVFLGFLCILEGLTRACELIFAA